MNIDDYNSLLKNEMEQGEKKVNLFQGHEHSNKWGPLRRCRNKNCMEAFTPHEICPTCSISTHKI